MPDTEVHLIYLPYIYSISYQYFCATVCYSTGLVAIRFGALTVDPVTGVLAPVVGVRLDVSRQTVVPVTASYCLALGDNTDSVLVRKINYTGCVSFQHVQLGHCQYTCSQNDR